MNQYQKFIHTSRYARWVEEQGRRETWEETVGRYCQFFFERMTEDQQEKLQHWFVLMEQEILDLNVMPSMRALMTAGPALERDNVAGYNCSYLPIDSIQSFDELLYILACGTGVGFSVERQYVNQLPEISEIFHDSDSVIIVPDSKIGWAKSLRELIHLLYAGQVPKIDYSKIRPSGAILKTFGGRASGPDPLENLFNYVIDKFRQFAGTKLPSIACHDICCKIAQVIVVGGVRRSALISLSNLTDERMRSAKNGNWPDLDPQRALANNSVCYTETPDIGIFMREWQSLYESRSGERGLFNRVAAKKLVAKNGRRDPEHDFGTNPCSEIILRPYQFCNLSEVVIRGSDTESRIEDKVRMAAFIGTLQSTLTDFRYLRKRWRDNVEEERLLGVSLTGICDNILTANPSEKLEETLRGWRDLAVETNREIAEILEIPQSAAVTCVKPSGTVSQLVNSSSGIHPRYSAYYRRTVRQDIKDPVTGYLIGMGVEHEQDKFNPNAVVFSFYVKGPEDSVFRNDRSALEQLELWEIYAKEWCEHKPSITVYVKEHEWMKVGAWVYENFDIVSGVSFLPHSNHNYEQAPYQEITKEEYEEKVKQFPVLDFSDVVESDDNTIGSQELACVGGACEI